MLGEELDIYNDLDEFQQVEDQKSKELEACEARCNSAQVEITNLQAQNKALQKKIKTMEVNFQNLLDTAKAEIKRKDALINQLRKEKDDICFRRKHPTRFQQAKPLNIDQRPEQNTFKRVEDTAVKAATVTKTKMNHEHSQGHNPFKRKEIAVDKSTISESKPLNEGHNVYQEYKLSKREDKNTISSNVDHKSDKRQLKRARSEHKTQPQESKKQCSSERTERSSRQWSAEARRIHDKDRERNRHRSRSREKNRNIRNTKSKSRRSQSRSLSRHRSRSKGSKRHCIREVEEKSDKKEKNTILESLFGNTPKHNSSTDVTNEESEILEKLMENAEPLTPQEFYTPQSQTESTGNNSKSEETVISNQQAVEEVNNYFSSNAIKIKEIEESLQRATVEAQVMEQIPRRDIIVEGEIIIEQTNVEHFQILNEENVQRKVDDTQIIPGLDLIADEGKITKETQLFQVIDEDNAPKQPDCSRIIQQISGLDLIAGEELFNAQTELFQVLDEQEMDHRKIIAGLDIMAAEEITEEQATVQLFQVEANDNATDKFELIENKASIHVKSKDINSPENENILANEFDVHVNNEVLYEEINSLENEIILAKKVTGQENVDTISIVINSQENKSVPYNIIDSQDIAINDPPLEEVEVVTITETEQRETIVEMLKSTAKSEKNRIKEHTKNSNLNLKSNDAKEQGTTLLEASKLTTPSRKSRKNTRRSTEITPQDSQANAADTKVTPKRRVRSTKEIEIIEDIRLPALMDIEHIAIRVDGSIDNPNKDELKNQIVETPITEVETQPDNDNEQFKSVKNISGETATLNAEPKSKVIVAATILTPKPCIMYAQPDSTKIDHNDETAINVLIPAEPQAKSCDQNETNVNLEADKIELALEQLHQQSHNEELPDETTVTSTSMKASQDLIKILTQSPGPKPTPGTKAKGKTKKTGARTASEKTTSKSAKSASVTPESLETTPLKKRKINLKDEKRGDPIVPQTPPDAAKATTPTQHHVTIDETLNTSSLEQNLSFGSDSSIVTKRCSLGNTDYQFERINDEVVLRVTRRPRRRRVPTPAAINESKAQ